MMQKNNDIHNFKILTIYSVIAYLLAYWMVFLSYNIFTALIAILYDIKSILYHTKLLFVPKNNSPLWTFNSAFFIFISGTLFLMLTTFILMRIYKKHKYREGLKKLLLFWIIMHSINRILGLFIIGTIVDLTYPNLGLWYSNVILNWFFIGHWMKIIMAIAIFALLFWIGGKTTRPLLLSAKSLKFVEDRKRLFFVWSQAFKVWFFSSIILFILHLPALSLAENFLSVSMFFLIIPSYFNHESIVLPHSTDEREEPEYKKPWKYIIWTIVFILIVRIILWKGIPFYFN